VGYLSDIILKIDCSCRTKNQRKDDVSSMWLSNNSGNTKMFFSNTSSYRCRGSLVAIAN